jgi:CxxC motif-containing protein
MAEKMVLICITCPKGCELKVTREGSAILDVESGCKRGVLYAKEELLDPRRMVATTVKISGSAHPLLPVSTRSPFPKPRIHELLVHLRQVEVSAPVKMGDVVLSNVLDTGIDIIASRSM